MDLYLVRTCPDSSCFQGATVYCTDTGVFLPTYSGIAAGALLKMLEYNLSDSSEILTAFLGHFDFIYCTADAWLAVPFTFIGVHLL